MGLFVVNFHSVVIHPSRYDEQWNLNIQYDAPTLLLWEEKSEQVANIKSYKLSNS